ncbi:MAG TPA: dihydropteroate synthase [Acetobacteraceae bacterium]|nr:dihydropteroate synthase [Acetobacteraceae bacterium]
MIPDPLPTAPRLPSWGALPDRHLVMGIVNVTPDSFSNGGDMLAPEAAIEAGLAMVAAGADLLDIGGETTRPGAPPTPPAVEQARILPVIRGLAARGVPLSVDTRNAGTMAAALEAGATIINDVSGLTYDPEAAPLVARRGCPVVLMHMRGIPETMQSLTQYEDVVADVRAELAACIAAAEAAGIARESIAIDPGFGFAKTEEQNLALMRGLPALLDLGYRVLIGVSRKGFIGRITGETAPKRRLGGSLAAALFALDRGASILRVHDVPETVQAVHVWRALVKGRPGALPLDPAKG